MPDLYNLKRAKQLNYLPDSIGHLPSRDYKTGLLLKHPAHPTFKKGLEEDKKLGYTPMMDMFGNVYTVSPNDIPTEGYFSPNKTNTQMKNTFATGGQMRNATNSQFVPSYVNGVPVYGFGSWLKKNAGNVLQVAGGVGAMFIPGMQGVGATLIGNGVTGALDQGLQDKQQKDAEAMQRADAERSFMLNQYNDSQQVFASPEGFAKGGSIHIDPSKRGTFTAAATKHGQSVQGFASQVLANKDKYSPAMVKKAVFAHNFAKANGGFVPTYEQGGFMNGLKFYNDGGDIDGLTYFPVGGTHESNPNNGIPLGGNALVEEGEFMWESPTRGKYIFSNRF